VNVPIALLGDTDVVIVSASPASAAWAMTSGEALKRLSGAGRLAVAVGVGVGVGVAGLSGDAVARAGATVATSTAGVAGGVASDTACLTAAGAAAGGADVTPEADESTRLTEAADCGPAPRGARVATSSSPAPKAARAASVRAARRRLRRGGRRRMKTGPNAGTG
jgi:hypothetical protein